MKQCYYDAAKLLHETLRIKTNCYDENEKIIRATQIVAIDDDAISALYAALLFYEIRRTYGYSPKMLCVGGKGLMSKHTHQKSEAELLAYVLERLGIDRQFISCLGEGRNSGDNVLAVANATPKGEVTLWCVTQRLSLRLERTQAQQALQLKSYYFVIEESIAEVMKYYNGKGLCGGQMLLHELASILNRCEAYAGTFQAPIPFPVSQDVRDAAAWLESRYRLKLPHKNLRSVRQFVWLLSDVLLHKEKMANELKQTLAAEM